MILKDIHLRKSDPSLQQKLKDAKGNEKIRIVASLGQRELEAPQTDDIETLDPSKFLSRTRYRAALIQKRKQEMAAKNRSTIQSLEDLSLSVKGGEISNVVVIEGLASQILASLELPGVSHASLDQTIEVIMPQRQSS